MGRVLLNFSGGLDSTLCLYLALLEGRSVLVHHIRLKNHEGRQKFEHNAVMGILEWLRAEGLDRFEYVESGFDYGSLRFIVKDVKVWSFLTGVVLADPKNRDIDEVIIPRHLDSFRYRLGAEESSRQKRVSDESRNVLVKNVCGRTPRWLFPIGEMTKAEIIAALPYQLRVRSWYCRRPIEGKPCHRCYTCEQVDAATATAEAV